MIVTTNNYTKAISRFNNDSIGVIPTDTIYGISCKVSNKNLVEKIYKIKNRDLSKPLIILISDVLDLNLFNITIDEKIQKHLKLLWPGPNTIILPCPHEKFKYLHRGTNQIAFRIPNKPQLIDLLKKTGPLVSTSANPEGQPPAKSVEEAQKYFTNTIDFYIDEGILDNKASTIYKIENNKLEILRN